MINISGPIKLIRESLSIFLKKENFIYFLKIYAVLLPFAVFSWVQDVFISPGFGGLNTFDATDLLSKWGPLLAVNLVVGLIYLVVSFWVQTAGIVAVANVVSGTTVGIGETFKAAYRKLWKYSLLTILVGLIVGLGFIFFLVPGIIFGVWFGFASFELITGDKKIIESIKASKLLVKGNFWKVFGRFFVFGLFALLVQLIFSVIPFSVSSLVIPLLGALFVLPNFLLYRELQA